MNKTIGASESSENKQILTFEGINPEWMAKRKSMLNRIIQSLKSEILELNNKGVSEFDDVLYTVNNIVNDVKSNVLAVLGEAKIIETNAFDGKDFQWIKSRNKVCKRILQLLNAEKKEFNSKGIINLDPALDHSIKIITIMQQRVIKLIINHPDCGKR